MGKKKDFEVRCSLLRDDPDVKDKRLHIRLSDIQKYELHLKAEKYTNGNLSEWVLISALEYKPWGYE